MCAKCRIRQDARLRPSTRSLPTPDDLTYWMSKFVHEASECNGDEYPPKTLHSLVCCFKHYFNDSVVSDINPLNPSTRNLITL